MSDEEHDGNMACRSCVKIPLAVSQQMPKARNHGDYLAFPDVKITGNHLEGLNYGLHYGVFFHSMMAIASIAQT